MYRYAALLSSSVLLSPALFAILVATLLAPLTIEALTLDDFENGTVSASALNGEVKTASTLTATAIGGARKLRVETFTGGTTSDTNAFVEFGIFGHSQDAQTTGESRLIWDGGTGSFSPTGLGGLDLTDDGSTSIVLDLLSFDFPGSQSMNIFITVYDAADLNGNTSSTAVVTLSSVINVSTIIKIPFSSFTLSGPAGPASFTNVGAIVMRIDGSSAPASDLTLEWLGTDGSCDAIVPQANIPAIDQCGVCGGDNSSCADCNGVPNGNSISDRCGVCDGDGKSCLGCDTTDIKMTQFRLDGGAKKHEKVINAMTARLLAIAPTAKNRSFVAKTNVKAHELQIRNWILSWSLPTIINLCENQLFCTSSSNNPILDEYRTHSEELRKLGLRVLGRIKRELGGDLDSSDNKLGNKSQKIHETNLALADTVPEDYSTCS